MRSLFQDHAMEVVCRVLSITCIYCVGVAVLKQSLPILSSLRRLLRPQTIAVVPQAKRRARKDEPIQETVTSLGGFDYKQKVPEQYRPFLAKGHVKMGIYQSKMEDWIKIDHHYLHRMNYRQKLLERHPSVTMQSTPIARPAIEELYTELTTLLPTRFPKMFTTTPAGDFINLTTGRYHHMASALRDPDPNIMLQHLGENVEEDFYLMLPNSEGFYELQAFVSCFPQGFVPSSRMGQTVEQIHGPVPGYEERLRKGVNRCFQRMGRGQTVGRLNWALQLSTPELHLPFDGANTKSSPTTSAPLDPVKSFLRCEHHTLRCLPKTGAIVFCVRSYLYPLSQIRDEGNGQRLAEACESMSEKFGVYKNRPVWGEEICRWLREGGDKAERGEGEGGAKRAKFDATRESICGGDGRSVCPGAGW